MARLTSFSRLLITVALVAGVFFAVRTFLPQLTKSSSSTAEPAQTESPAATNNAEPAATTDATPSSTSSWGKSGGGFSYSAIEPANGKLKGVAELGATGFNYFIVRIDAQKNWKLEKAEFGVSLVKENLATDADIKTGLKTYIADMAAFGVNPKDIHFVISSGAKKAEVTDKIIATLKSMGYYVNIVTPLQEAQLAYRAAVPQSFQNKGFAVDIGSGNTKIAWLSGGSPTGVELPGAKYYQNNMSEGAVYQDVNTQAKRVPAGMRSTCFIIGGVPFELAKQTRNGKERYTVLKAPGDYKADGEKQKAGLNIYKAIADATGCQQFVFDWDANFTIGFLLNLNK
ncbi:MAG: hypothetical protein IT260_03810 [Saprospiraceae bacterium]|nr:hypothetical protein [Saprospiraceae bacterium]